MGTGPQALDDAMLAALIANELDQADGGRSDALQAHRREAVDYYYGRARPGDQLLTEHGRSTLRSSDVSDMVEAVVAQLAPALADTSVAAFQPVGEGDEDQAELETAIVGDQINQANDGYLELQAAVKDALLARTGWLKVWVDTDTDEITERLNSASEDVLAMVYLSREENETIKLVSQEPMGTSERGEQLYDVTLKRTITHTTIRVEARRADDMSYATDWQRTTIEGCRFVAERAEFERAELLEMGVSRDLVESIGPYTNDSAGYRAQRSTTGNVQLGGHQWATELVECHICHVYVDIEGNGKTALYRVLYADDQVLQKEQVAFLPYVNGWALMRPYRIDGVSLHDKLKPVEDGKTHALRQWGDNLVNQNNARAGLVEGQVRVSDWITRQPGGYVRIKSPDAIVPLASHDLGPSARNFLDYQDKMRSERGGASLDLQSAEAQIAGHTAAGTERQYTARELLAALMARNVAETLVRGLYRLVHRTMRTSSMANVEMKRAGEWQREDPRTWKERSRLTVALGLTVAERSKIQGALRETIGLQTTAMQNGFRGTLVDLPQLHAAALELAKASGLPAPERFYIDPASPEAKQAAQQQQQAAQAQQQDQAQQRQALLTLTLTQERYMHDTEQRFKRYKQDTDTELGYFKELLEAQTERETTEAELVANASIQLANKASDNASRNVNGSGANNDE